MLLVEVRRTGPELLVGSAPELLREHMEIRGLGIINIANSAPQVLGPALAFPIVAYLGGYPVLYLVVAAVTVLGSVLVTRIRSVD